MANFIIIIIIIITTATTTTTATTFVAIPYHDGIVIGADTRTTSSNTYVSHTHNVYKIIPLNDHVVLARAGNAAATQHYVQQLQQIQHSYYIKHNRILSVSQLAHCLRNMVYQQASQSSSSSGVEMLLVGVDPSNTDICQLYSIAPSGAIIRIPNGQYATAGSGSVYITGYLQEHCSKLHTNDDNPHRHTSTLEQTPTTPIVVPSLNEVEAIQICRRAIEIAIRNDASSGGAICIYTISSSLPSKSHDDDDNENNNHRSLNHFVPTTAITQIQQRYYTMRHNKQ